jgi:CRP/FNR family cyclic AMP-dependent transcriptional regulator
MEYRKELLSLKPGDLLIHEGSTGKELFMIMDGRARAYVVRNGKKFPLAGFSRGDMLGELSLVDQKARSASVEAMTAMKVVRIRFDQFSTEDPEALPWIVLMVKGLSARMRVTNQKLVAMQSALDWIKQTQGGQLSRHLLQDTQRLLQALVIATRNVSLPLASLKVQESVERSVGTHSVPWNSFLRALDASAHIALNDGDEVISVDHEALSELCEALAQSSLSVWKSALSPDAESILESLCQWAAGQKTDQPVQLGEEELRSLVGSSDTEWSNLGLDELEKRALLERSETGLWQLHPREFLARFKTLRFISELGLAGLFPEKSSS